MTGKTLYLYLMDGDPSGRIKCTLANWTGLAYKIPRTMLEKARDIPYLQQTGVYFLFGTSNGTGNPVVYIGQAGIRKNGQGILNRWEEHKRNNNKDWWTEAVALTTSNNSFGSTEISYLENRFSNMAINAERYEVMNINDPTQGNLTEEKESEMEEFISYARLVMGALGYKVFEPLIVQTETINLPEILNEEPILFSCPKSAYAKAKRTSEGFVILRGSKISEECAKSAPNWVRELRKKNAQFIQSDGVISKDLLFNSPSAAASFVSGGSSNGLIAWKTEDGKTLKDLEAQK